MITVEIAWVIFAIIVILFIRGMGVYVGTPFIYLTDQHTDTYLITPLRHYPIVTWLKYRNSLVKGKTTRESLTDYLGVQIIYWIGAKVSARFMFAKFHSAAIHCIPHPFTLCYILAERFSRGEMCTCVRVFFIYRMQIPLISIVLSRLYEGLTRSWEKKKRRCFVQCYLCRKICWTIACYWM